MKKLKLNYLLIGVVALLLAVALWPTVPWTGGTENRIAAIKARGELRVSTIASPLTWSRINNEETVGLDYELAREFADYLGVELKITVRSGIDKLFDDLDTGAADILAAGLVYNNARSKNYQPGPAYYSVSQQMVYRMGSPRPKSLAGITSENLTIAAGLAVLNDLNTLKQEKYPHLEWRVDATRNSTMLLRKVLDGTLAYTIADSVAIGLFQRIHPQLAVALDITDEQPVTWFTPRDSDDSLSAAMLDFFARVNANGTLSRLEEKYLGHVGAFDYVDTRSFLRAVDNILPSLLPLFKKYATRIDWRLLAAIAYQESHWDTHATSPTGVRGLMMLTKNTAQSLGLTDRLNAEQSIRGGARYLNDMLEKVPDSVPEGERIWFALAAYNMGYAHMLDARALTAKLRGNPDSWSDVKQTLPLLSQKNWYKKTTYGYARGHEALAYVENIRKYHMSLVGYLMEKTHQKMLHQRLAQSYPVVKPPEVAQPRMEPALMTPVPDTDEDTSSISTNSLMQMLTH
ncbi:membrane-bound lytic murein transglycosylase MltF [Erwinia sp. HR93]|uniref:membrane-bound lytic murein transglycosylase MltF n=1 Tax=Erwinia sp. HR93 TaxID=3094840 RepID=UPI002ADEC4B8|nr:membrane-bound lytic murein transglycosylase MltF [Erwinia sp. HR93]MEA1064316.1 membrane-bound lytic murein transglycosylase MltF [Erwinia sp. HR93]